MKDFQLAAFLGFLCASEAASASSAGEGDINLMVFTCDRHTRLLISSLLYLELLLMFCLILFKSCCLDFHLLNFHLIRFIDCQSVCLSYFLKFWLILLTCIYLFQGGRRLGRCPSCPILYSGTKSSCLLNGQSGQRFIGDSSPSAWR